MTGTARSWLAVLVIAGACTASDRLSVDAIEAQAASLVGRDQVELTCPDVTRDSADCTLAIDGQQIPLHARLSDDGEIDVELQAAILDRATTQSQLESQIAETVDLPATVDCGDHDRVVIGFASTLECQVTTDDETTGIATVALNSTGDPTLVELTPDE